MLALRKSPRTEYTADFQQADWNPKEGDAVHVEGSECKWKIGSVSDILWGPQITAPMPFEAIYDIISKGVSGQSSPFLGKNPSPNWRIVKPGKRTLRDVSAYNDTEVASH